MAENLPSRLLELPGERRHRIHRYSLVEEIISVNSNNSPEPSLLSVCKATRAAASTIFYKENRFWVVVQKYNCIPFLTALAKLSALEERMAFRPSIKINQFGRPNWQNLETWLRIGHASGSGLLKPGDLAQRSDNPKTMQILALHKTVARLRDLPWERVQPILQDFHQTLVAIDRRWAG